MAFKKKTWIDRMVEFAGRRKITNVSTSAAQIIDVERAEGAVSQEGDAFSAENMNDLEKRISDAFADVPSGYKIADNDTTNNSEFLATARVAYEHGLEIDALSRDLDVGSDSGMTIGSMVKAIYDKVINSAAISGHLRGGRSRGGSGTGEVTFNNIKKGSTITISSVVIPSGAGEAIKTTVDGDIVITGAGSYTLTKDGTVKITAHVYLGEEGTSGYAECDFKIV